MAPAAKNATPGRRKKTDQQYFEVGKVGRKTGITLKDTGIRDEHGLEPVSGIFSSPTSPEANGNPTLMSDGMDLEGSSAPDVQTTLSRRKTPRLPPPRQSTPKHTSIGGSPRRQSSARPASRHVDSQEPVSSPHAETERPANRRLDFGQKNRKRKSNHVVDTHSPFKPRHKLRRSNEIVEPDADEVEDEEPVETTGDDAGEEAEPSIEEPDDESAMVDNAISYHSELEQNATSMADAEVPAKRKRGRPRKSDQSNTSKHESKTLVPQESSSGKRSRTSLGDTNLTDTGDAPPSKRKRTTDGSRVVVHGDAHGTIDPSVISYGDQFLEDDLDDDPDAQLQDAIEAEPESQPEPPPKGKGRGKGKRGKEITSQKNDPHRATKRGSPDKVNGSSAKMRSHRASAGPVSNVHLRATTPAADAGSQSRFGRNLIQPLKFWANESLIWKQGEIEGIVRAEAVDTTKPKTKRRKRPRKHNSHMQSIDEESEAESTMPDDWEEELGVITGVVAKWNSETKSADLEDPVEEDLGFAAPSIVTREVAGSDFRYAKITTNHFFGAGVIELPPEGFKRAKNSRKMQMAFFIHQGKVKVEIGATGMEENEFALSKGGACIVPRGNNYAITNESRTKTALIFYAQGNEVAAPAAAASHDA